MSEGDGDAVVCVIKEGVSDEDIEVLVEAIVSGRLRMLHLLY